jgi:hypothetical protein
MFDDPTESEAVLTITDSDAWPEVWHIFSSVVTTVMYGISNLRVTMKLGTEFALCKTAFSCSTFEQSLRDICKLSYL